MIRSPALVCTIVAASTALLALPRTSPAQCVPAPIVNSASATAGDLLITMGIDRFQCHVGEPVTFHLSAYNGGATTVILPNPYMVSAIHQWAVLPDSCTTLYEPDGCHVDTPFYSPQGVFFFGVPFPIAPGACLTFSVVWNGLHWGNPALPVIPGSYHVRGGFLPGENQTTSQGALLPTFEIPLTILPEEQVPVMPTSWSAIKARLR